MTQFSHKMIYVLKCHFHVMDKFYDFFTLRPSDQITTLTYVLMNNFCPCFQKVMTLRVKNKYHIIKFLTKVT